MAGVPFEQLQQGLAQLQAPGRRFDFRGDWQGRQIVDDYAHHPSEVRATLTMARLMVNSGRSALPRAPQRLMVVFQPHRFSRTAIPHVGAPAIGPTGELCARTASLGSLRDAGHF